MSNGVAICTASCSIAGAAAASLSNGRGRGCCWMPLWTIDARHSQFPRRALRCPGQSSPRHFTNCYTTLQAIQDVRDLMVERGFYANVKLI